MFKTKSLSNSKVPDKLISWLLPVYFLATNQVKPSPEIARLEFNSRDLNSTMDPNEETKAVLSLSLPVSNGSFEYFSASSGVANREEESGFVSGNGLLQPCKEDKENFRL